MITIMIGEELLLGIIILIVAYKLLKKIMDM